MYTRPTTRSTLGGGGGGLSGPFPPDLLILAGVLLLSVTLSAFESTRFIPQLLTITPLVWQSLFLWQVVTYPFIETGGPSLWFILTLVMLFLWGRDVYWGLGRRHFWRLLLFAGIGAGIIAALVDLALTLSGWIAPNRLVMMQGWTLLAILLAAWARAHRGATILFMFILPIQAEYYVILELLLAFLGFLGTRDVAGFVGICTAIGLGWYYVDRSGRIGLRKKDLREYRLRMERWWIQQKLNRAKKKRGFRVIPGDKPGAPDRGPRKGPWVN
ncbi:MAG TPA: hypothetical protein VN493_19635 [Thermoanaerobaculia bacterium]|nr:hypothetical protein [Thermoanaerobaculia bacterium]